MAEREKWSYKDYTDTQETLDAKAERDKIEASKPKDFKYNSYVESDTVKAAKDALSAQLAQKPNAYQSQWQNSINDTINKIMNREKFSYDLNGDALYQQYKDQYTTQGKLAMMDTMGQAMAATGGYGSSYAQSVGQQTYQGYLQQLNDRVPELYQMALDQYNREGDELYNQYGLYSDMENRDYSKYRDTVSDYNTERDYLTNRYYSESEMDYGRYNDAYNRAYGQYRDSVSDWQNQLNRADSEYWNQKQFGYGQYTDDRSLSYQDYTWNAEFDEALRQYNEQFAYQKERDKIADDQWQKSYDLSSKASSSSGGGGGGGSTSENLNHVASMSSADLVSTMQGYNADGDDSGLASFLDDCVASGRLTEAQADSYYTRYRTGKTSVTTDTTVDRNRSNTGSTDSLTTSGLRREKMQIMKN